MCALAVVMTIGAMLGGCATLNDSPDLAKASSAYQAGEYARTYQLASPLASTYIGEGSYHAAYLAGLSAEQLGRPSTAAMYLRMASRSDDKTLSGDAAAALGMLYAKQGRYRESAEALKQAAGQLTGENQAHAYFYEGIAEQKLGLWSQARMHLVIARSKTNSPSFQQQINEQIDVTGYTLQTGAFSDRARAKAAAQKLAEKARGKQIGLPRLVRSDSSSGNGSLTLVQIGQFSSFDSANHARQILGNDQAIIVPLSR